MSYLKLLTVLILPIVALGCFAYDEEEIDDLSQEAYTWNAYTWNAYTWNAYTWNAYTWNAYTWNSLTEAGLPDQLISAMSDTTPTPDGKTRGHHVRTTFKYFYSCAAGEDDSIAIYPENAPKWARPWVFRGSLGLAPEWLETGNRSRWVPACDESCKRWVSACVISRINAYGISVPLSLRGPNPALWEQSPEESEHTYYEGTFWGNLLTSEPELYACASEPLELEFGPGEYESIYLHQRACGEGYNENCGMTHVGGCYDYLSQPDHAEEIVHVFLDPSGTLLDGTAIVGGDL